MPNLLKIDMADFVKDLRAEPTALAQASAPFVRASAEQAAEEIRAAYPVGPPRKQNDQKPGNLKAGVRVRPTKSDPAVSSGVVISGAPHAHLYEFGTHVARAHPTFFPIVNRQQRELISNVADMIDARDGYTVTGS